jgi:hypothetical protein
MGALDAAPFPVERHCAEFGKSRQEGGFCSGGVLASASPARAAARQYIARLRIAIVTRCAPDVNLDLVAAVRFQ